MKRQQLPQLLRQTADRLEAGAHYEWGHMGRCNCGHLVQTVTKLSAREIAQTVDDQLDEWTEHAKDRCQVTGNRVEDLFLALAEVGFGRQDVMSLEYLNDPRVLRRLGATHLRRNHRPDVALYMRTLAEIIEETPAPVAAARA